MGTRGPGPVGQEVDAGAGVPLTGSYDDVVTAFARLTQGPALTAGQAILGVVLLAVLAVALVSATHH